MPKKRGRSRISGMKQRMSRTIEATTARTGFPPHEKDRRNLHDACEGGQGQKNTEGLFSKQPIIIGIGNIRRHAEHTHYHMRSQYKQKCSRNADDSRTQQNLTKQASDPCIVPGTDIISDYRLTSEHDTDNDIDDHRKHFVFNAHYCNRNVHTILAIRRRIGPASGC